jgi:hypothetical protein
LRKKRFMTADRQRIHGYLKGKTVAVSLSLGRTMKGVAKGGQNNLLHLERLSQKEFYDALIRVDQTNAIEVRAR